MKIVAIDPSVRNVGWAMVDGLARGEDDEWLDEHAEWKWGNWILESKSYTFRLREIVEWIILEAGGLSESDWLVAEWPAYFDSMAGHIAARAGHTINLAGIDCYIAGFFRLPWQNIHLITATEWKGSVSKEITRRRFFKHMGIKQIYKIDHNAVDAVMMLLEFCRRKAITLRIVSKTMDYLTDQR